MLSMIVPVRIHLVSIEIDGSNCMILQGICVPGKRCKTGFTQYCGRNGRLLSYF